MENNESKKRNGVEGITFLAVVFIVIGGLFIFLSGTNEIAENPQINNLGRLVIACTGLILSSIGSVLVMIVILFKKLVKEIHDL